MKRTKQIISIALAVLMLASLFTFAANATTTINKVEIKGVVTPYTGENPVADVFRLDYPFNIKDVKWYNNDNVVEDEKFLDNALYTIVVTITPKAGYEFADSLDCYINGQNAVLNSGSTATEARVAYTFTAKDRQYYPEYGYMAYYFLNEFDFIVGKPATQTESGYVQIIPQFFTDKDGNEVGFYDENDWDYDYVSSWGILGAGYGDYHMYEGGQNKLDTFAYNGKVQHPKPIFNLEEEDVEGYFSVKYLTGCKNVGTHKMKVTMKGPYAGSKTVSFKIVKAANPIKVTAKNKTVKYSSVQKKNVTVKALTVKKAQGKVTYKKTKGSKNLSVNKKNGKITVKKGTKKGKYTIKIKTTAKGTKNYKAKSVIKAFKITVK